LDFDGNVNKFTDVLGIIDSDVAISIPWIHETIEIRTSSATGAYQFAPETAITNLRDASAMARLLQRESSLLVAIENGQLGSLLASIPHANFSLSESGNLTADVTVIDAEGRLGFEKEKMVFEAMAGNLSYSSSFPALLGEVVTSTTDLKNLKIYLDIPEALPNTIETQPGVLLEDWVISVSSGESLTSQDNGVSILGGYSENIESFVASSLSHIEMKDGALTILSKTESLRADIIASEISDAPISTAIDLMSFEMGIPFVSDQGGQLRFALELDGLSVSPSFAQVLEIPESVFEKPVSVKMDISVSVLNPISQEELMTLANLQNAMAFMGYLGGFEIDDIVINDLRLSLFGAEFHAEGEISPALLLEYADVTGIEMLLPGLSDQKTARVNMRLENGEMALAELSELGVLEPSMLFGAKMFLDGFTNDENLTEVLLEVDGRALSVNGMRLR
jgi:hypothetical protein